ncbi:MAG: HD domain-containing protein, partial [Halioglobus sp.]|nr:HD domain-containing protein [Halioglobus sp.]
MVRVREQFQTDAAGRVDLPHWLRQLHADLDADEEARVLEACELAQRAGRRPGVDTLDWAHGGDSFTAGLDIAQVLADLHVDADCLLAGILYRAVREERLDQRQVAADFGAGVSELISGVLRMAAIGQLPLASDTPVLGQATDQKDNIRKMLIAMVDDVRVALIKLAERTCAIRTVKDDEERRRRVGQEVFDVYAPLAHRLGIGQLKWELEDLSFRYIHPDAYRKIARLLDGKRMERDRFIERVSEEVSRVLTGAGLEFEIAGRAKHIYSIWRKMQRKG